MPKYRLARRSTKRWRRMHLSLVPTACPAGARCGVLARAVASCIVSLRRQLLRAACYSSSWSVNVRILYRTYSTNSSQWHLSRPHHFVPPRTGSGQAHLVSETDVFGITREYSTAETSASSSQWLECSTHGTRLPTAVRASRSNSECGDAKPGKTSYAVPPEWFREQPHFGGPPRAPAPRLRRRDQLRYPPHPRVTQAERHQVDSRWP